MRKTGMGPEKARLAAGSLGEAGGPLLVVGFCGGLDGESVPGEVLVPAELYAATAEGHPEDVHLLVAERVKRVHNGSGEARHATRQAIPRRE